MVSVFASNNELQGTTQRPPSSIKPSLTIKCIYEVENLLSRLSLKLINAIVGIANLAWPFLTILKYSFLIILNSFFALQAHANTLRGLRLRVNCSRTNADEGPTTFRVEENNSGRETHFIFLG